MIVHSDAIGGIVFFFAMLGSALILVIALMSLAGRKFRLAGKIFAWWSVFAVSYTASVILVSLFQPQKIVNPGQSYCVDSWCIGIQSVTKTALGQNTAYKTDVRIFSDLNRGSTSAKRVSIYLGDERGRRFSLIPDPSATPLDTELTPKQSVNTSLTFLVAADAHELFLTGDGAPGPWITKFFIGDDSALLHRPTLLRVQ
jgi:hypothetical protein